MAKQESCTTDEFLQPVAEIDPPFEQGALERLLTRGSEVEKTSKKSAVKHEPGDVFNEETNQFEAEPLKPHPLRSPVNQRAPLVRAATISAIRGNVNEDTHGDRNLSKTPLKVKWGWSAKETVLEDDTPFPHIDRGMYFALGTQGARNIHNHKVNGAFNKDTITSSSEQLEGYKKHSTRHSGIVRLARKISHRGSNKEKYLRSQGRSQSLENLASPNGNSQNNASLQRVPAFQRAMSVHHRPSPKVRHAYSENRFSTINKDIKDKAKKKKDSDLDAFIDAVVRQDVEDIKQILETGDVDINGCNDEGFAPLDCAVMLGFHSIAKMLLSFGATESDRLQRNFLDKHLKMLLKEAERKVDDLTTATVHITNITSSENKENEKQFQEWLLRRHLLSQMLKGLKKADPPDRPSCVSLSVASEDSLHVRFSEPVDDRVVVTKYKVQWSKTADFEDTEGERTVYDLRSMEYTINDLQKSVLYYVRLCCGNVKDFGPWLESSPPCATPSSWHEVNDSKPRFQGRLDVIDDLFGRVWQSHEEFSPHRSMYRPRSNTFGNENDTESVMSPKPSRKEAMKKSWTKYTNILFHSAPKFVKSLKSLDDYNRMLSKETTRIRQTTFLLALGESKKVLLQVEQEKGVYLAALMYTGDERVLVTLDDQLPILEVDDDNPSTFFQDFCWLMKVACTWKDVTKLKEEVQKNSASTSVLFRCKLLQAVDALQTALGKQNLGQLHYKPVKDQNGTTIIVAVNYVNHASSFRPRIMSLKWITQGKLQRKLPMQVNSHEEPYAADALLSSAPEKVQYYEQSRKSLERGLYIGYLKLRTFVDAIHVVVQECCPNVLPHVKIRDNPNVSREEWQWLQSLETRKRRTFEPSKTAHEFQVLVAESAETLMTEVGVSIEASKLHRIYDREVVELDENVSFIIVFPPPEDVCSAPGQVDTLDYAKGYMSLPVQMFEMIHMYTYQRDFICHYSRLSSVLDTDDVITKQALREAFSPVEVETARLHKQHLMEFQRELDETWKGMRWILDALHYARDRQVRGGIPLVEVFAFSQEDAPGEHNSDLDHVTTCNGHERNGGHNVQEGILMVHTAAETGLPIGATVTLQTSTATTASEVVKMVLWQLEKTCAERGKVANHISKTRLEDFCLVAVSGPKEKCFADDSRPLDLQNPWQRGKLYIRLRSEALAASVSGQFTSV